MRTALAVHEHQDVATQRDAPLAPFKDQLGCQIAELWRPERDHFLGRDQGLAGDQTAVDPSVAPLVESQVAHLLNRGSRNLVHRRVQILVSWVHARKDLLVLVVQVLIRR